MGRPKRLYVLWTEVGLENNTLYIKNSSLSLDVVRSIYCLAQFQSAIPATHNGGHSHLYFLGNLTNSANSQLLKDNLQNIDEDFESMDQRV